MRNARAELEYKRALFKLVQHLRDAVEGLLPTLQNMWHPTSKAGDCAVVGDSVVVGDVASLVSQIDQAKMKFLGLDMWARRMVGLAVKSNMESVDTRLASEIKRTIGVDVSAILRGNGGMLSSMQKATAENIALIKTIPEQYFGRVTETVTAGWSSGLRWESLVEQIQEDGNITERRAKLIARDQTAKMNSAFNQERQQQVGIEKYEWSTSTDERVRESHVDMDGEVCSWDKPPIVDDEAVHPGEAINCRCVAIPIVDMDEMELTAFRAEEELAS